MDEIEATAPAGTYGIQVDLDTTRIPYVRGTIPTLRDPYYHLAVALRTHGMIAGITGLYYLPGVLTLDRVREILRDAASKLPWLPTALRAVSIVHVQDVMPEPLADLREVSVA